MHMVEALQQNLINFLVRFDITKLHINELSHAEERESL